MSYDLLRLSLCSIDLSLADKSLLFCHFFIIQLCATYILARSKGILNDVMCDLLFYPVNYKFAMMLCATYILACSVQIYNDDMCDLYFSKFPICPLLTNRSIFVLSFMSDLTLGGPNRV